MNFVDDLVWIGVDEVRTKLCGLCAGNVGPRECDGGGFIGLNDHECAEARKGEELG